jgi:phenylalanyl-tRNA synthetase beta chain
MKFSYNWLRELVPGLTLEVSKLAQEITMKTAECEGIHDPGAFPGASIAEVAAAEKSQPDSIIEIDNKSLTNRPDLWGHLGMAREVAAICGLNVADPVGELPASAEHGAVSINITDAGFCSRFSAQLVENVKVAPSPLWLQYRMHSLGLTPINNLVDVTNYVLCELGQPMHAYDADLLGNTIMVRAAAKGESILALNGQTYSLSEEDIVIADASRSVGIAGIIGGNDTAIRSTTRSFMLAADTAHGARAAVARSGCTSALATPCRAHLSASDITIAARIRATSRYAKG